jgi:hypothetical protein
MSSSPFRQRSEPSPTRIRPKCTGCCSKPRSTLTIIAADPKHLGAAIGVTAVLHTWGQTLDHHPHVHCIVPGGGISPDGERWVRCRPNFFLSVNVLSCLFRRLFLEGLDALHAAGELQLFTNLATLNVPHAFRAYLAPLRESEWVVYAKRPFAGPAQVLAYLARYVHRVAIANSRLLSLSDSKVRFRWKDYKDNKTKVMTLEADEFIRRFLLHVLPDGFHRIRHYGLFANGHRADKLALCRKLLGVRPAASDCAGQDQQAMPEPEAEPEFEPPPCPCCGGRMKIIQTFDGPYSRPYHVRRLDAL